MAKQTIEIEVPDGKIADITKDGDKVVVTFKEVNLLDRLKTVRDVFDHMANLRGNGVAWADELLYEYSEAAPNSYSQNLTLYRIVVAALTNNEERHITTGERWYPVVQFCRSEDVKNCYGDHVIGCIESEGQRFVVVSGNAHSSLGAGLGVFHSYHGVSDSWACMGFRSVSRRDIALHISKYFGRLLFEVHYGGVNCDWKWID